MCRILVWNSCCVVSFQVIITLTDESWCDVWQLQIFIRLSLEPFFILFNCHSLLVYCIRGVVKCMLWICCNCQYCPCYQNTNEILQRIGIVMNCFTLLEKNIWSSHIHINTKVCLYNTYILPVLLYGCETWTVTKTVAEHLDAFDSCACGRSYVFRTSTTLLTIQCEASPPARQCHAGSSHSGCISLGTLLVPCPRRTIITYWLEEALVAWELPEDNRSWPSVLELWGPHGWEEGKR